MKDDDFNKIGKQLHDMEADPPRDGWKKIGAVLHTPGAAPTTWWRRHGWKPFVLLIPAALYLLYPNMRQQQAAGALSEITEAPPQASTESNPGLAARPATKAPDESVATPPAATVRPTDAAAVNTTEQASPTEMPVADQQPAQESQTSVPHFSIVSPLEIRATSSEHNIDSTLVAVTPAPPAVDSVSQQPEEEKSRPRAQWRINTTVMPQYIARTVRPSLNDEIWVTGVDKPRWKTQANVAFGLGIGRSIAPNWYIDAHLSYTSVRQDIFFSYATGKVDTLIAVRVDDQTVQVNPVYELAYREIQSRYDYAGIRLAATYYFWQGGRSRFNLMGGVSSHLLMSARVQERVGNAWVDLSEKRLNRTNYSASIGAGYSKMFGKGWEVHVNPTYTYFLREAKSQSVPYSLNQRSIGLMLMLSKSL
jgi:hypothetical protein